MKTRLLLTFLLLALFLMPLAASAESYHAYSYRAHKSTYAEGVQQTRYGKIARDPRAKKEFMKQTGYPKGRPGYVVDHIIPLKRGGPDDPSNMQWQTREEAREKDRWE